MLSRLMFGCGWYDVKERERETHKQAHDEKEEGIETMYYYCIMTEVSRHENENSQIGNTVISLYLFRDAVSCSQFSTWTGLTGSHPTTTTTTPLGNASWPSRCRIGQGGTAGRRARPTRASPLRRLGPPERLCFSRAIVVYSEGHDDPLVPKDSHLR